MGTAKSPADDLTPLLSAMLLMSAFHREHEKFYSAAPCNRQRLSNATRERCLPSPISGRRPHHLPLPGSVPAPGHARPERGSGPAARRCALHGGRG